MATTRGVKTPMITTLWASWTGLDIGTEKKCPTYQTMGWCRTLLISTAKWTNPSRHGKQGGIGTIWMPNLKVASTHPYVYRHEIKQTLKMKRTQGVMIAYNFPAALSTK
jgi:hypothetical protein